MTTTAPHQILASYSRATETITAEHHPADRGKMRFILHIVGGRHHGTEIHCRTEDSVRRLFDSVVAARKSDTEHPYLVPVRVSAN